MELGAEGVFLAAPSLGSERARGGGEVVTAKAEPQRPRRRWARRGPIHLRGKDLLICPLGLGRLPAGSAGEGFPRGLVVPGDPHQGGIGGPQGVREGGRKGPQALLAAAALTASSGRSRLLAGWLVCPSSPLGSPRKRGKPEQVGRRTCPPPHPCLAQADGAGLLQSQPP